MTKMLCHFAAILSLTLFLQQLESASAVALRQPKTEEFSVILKTWDNFHDDDVEDDGFENDVNHELRVQPEKTETSSRRGIFTSGFVKVFGKVGKYYSKASPWITPTAATLSLMNSVYRAFRGCCDTTRGCEYRDQFLAKKEHLGVLSKQADALELRASNLQDEVLGNARKYEEIYNKINDINNVLDVYISSLNPDINADLKTADGKILQAIKQKNRTENEMDYLQVHDMYESALETGFNVGFPLMGLLLSGGKGVYNYAKNKKAFESANKLQRKNAFKVKAPRTPTNIKAAMVRFGYAQAPKQLQQTKFTRFKDSMNVKFGKALKFTGKLWNVGSEVANIAGAAMMFYQIINTEMVCRKRAEEAKKALDEITKAEVLLNETISNITKAETEITETFNSVYGLLSAENVTIVLSKMKEMLETDSSNSQMTEVAIGIQRYINEIKLKPKPEVLYGIEERLIENLFKIPFTLRCYTTKVKIIRYVLQGCLAGSETVENLYKEGTTREDGNGNCVTKLGANYIDIQLLKQEVEAKMVEKNKERLCLANNVARGSRACQIKFKGASGVATDLDVSQEVAKVYLSKCPKGNIGMTKKDKAEACEFKAEDASLNEIVSIFGGKYDKATVQQALREC
ncbi:uncharacterized protein LOC116602196 [Nematostella vectensis]|uniref:uncharacterized protein LOC116602196 n=1 Tax=Nematostella vectensis TaxID=45351 RepID=UPI002076DF97|nr:uncharacterized protein LOC116602196 [Nematostella vectensis]XP_048581198.1 uncharacterized protein LOC116602196 [Nematostella vectensis]